MQVDISLVIVSIIGVLAVIAEVYFVPWIKSKMGNDDLIILFRAIEYFVAAAKQIGDRDGHDGSWRLAYVKEMLEKSGVTVDDTVEAFIEGIYFKLKNDLISE